MQKLQSLWDAGTEVTFGLSEEEQLNPKVQEMMQKLQSLWDARTEVTFGLSEEEQLNLKVQEMMQTLQSLWDAGTEVTFGLICPPSCTGRTSALATYDLLLRK